MDDATSLLIYAALWVAFGAWAACQYLVRPKPGC
jgi:hypothetical protein